MPNKKIKPIRSRSFGQPKAVLRTLLVAPYLNRYALKIMNNTILITFVFLLTVFNVNAVEYPKDPDAKVDEIIIKNIDFSGDGKNERIVYSVFSESFITPFKWSVGVYEGDHKLFYHVQDDKDIDEFFSDLGYVNNNCKTYLECKFTYYFNDIPNNLIQILFEKEYKHIQEKLHNDLIERKDLNKTKIEAFLKKKEAQSKLSGVPILHLLTSSVTVGEYYIYVPEIKEFQWVSYGCC